MNSNNTISKFFITFFSLVLIFSSACQNEEVDIVPEDKVLENIPFSVMSFNIRHHNDDDPQPLEVRKDLILNIITDETPDVVGLQEFSNAWFIEWMTNEMTKLGYNNYIDIVAGLGSPKAIFYKKDRFTRISAGTFSMNFSQGRTATWVILKDEANDQNYFMSNSHWTTSSSEDRVKTAERVLSEISKNYRGLPLVIFGDFNGRPNTPEIQKMENSPLGLINAHEDNLGTFHRWGPSGLSKLDYIYYTDKFELLESKVVRTSYDGFWPSDHWPVTATFEYK